MSESIRIENDILEALMDDPRVPTPGEIAVTAYDGSNEAYYGSRATPEQILTAKSVSNPGADRLRALIGRLISP